MDGFQVTEEHDENRQTNGRLSRGNRKNEEDKDRPDHSSNAKKQ